MSDASLLEHERERDRENAVELARLAAQLASLDKLMEARFVTFKVLVESQAEKVGLALAAADKAVSKAESATERRFESVNEFRGQLADQAARLIARTEFVAKTDAFAERISDLTARLDKSEGRGAGVSMGWAVLLGAVGLVATLITVGTFVFSNRSPQSSPQTIYIPVTPSVPPKGATP